MRNAALSNTPAARVYGPLTRTDFVRYQGASGDMNPIHHDEPFARASGYPGPLAVGMFTAGLMASWATDWLGPRNVRRTRIRWTKPCFAGMTLTISGVAAEPLDREEFQSVDVEITARDESEAVVCQVWITFHLPKEG